MMKRQHHRTCIGCRGIFSKDDLVRVIAGPEGAVLDYREKLPGRAAYVCPTRQCMKKAFSGENLSRALRTKVRTPAAEELVAQLIANIKRKIESLIAMSAKAGRLAAGFSAVKDAIEKGRVEVLISASDLSEGTKEKVVLRGEFSFREATLFTRDEMGRILNRELIGIIALEDKGLSDALWKETERLKNLINISN